MYRCDKFWYIYGWEKYACNPLEMVADKDNNWNPIQFLLDLESCNNFLSPRVTKLNTTVQWCRKIARGNQYMGGYIFLGFC